MSAFGVRSTVVLPSISPVLAIFAADHKGDVLLYVIQKDMVCLLRDDEILDKFVLSMQQPMCLVDGTYLVAAATDSTLLKLTHYDTALRSARSSFKEKLNCLSAHGNHFYSSSGARVYRHDPQDGHHLLRTFSDPVKALACADTKLLVLLRTSLHLLNPLTNQDLIEVACDVLSPIDIFWSVSLHHKLWFAALVQPEPMSLNRQHRILMMELDEVVTSKDITPDNIDHNRALVCRIVGNKLVTLADNGNVLLVHAVEDFGKRSLLYRAEATDIPFTAVEIVRESKARATPSLAVGTSNGAVALFSKLDDTNTTSDNRIHLD